ncbi:MAG: hypothetical protein EOP48_07555 [Sphingobacteriales bacterium]|nr:MAG: hypothetical protein EOP48_07555 [Sphingobacteriales bacterium]
MKKVFWKILDFYFKRPFILDLVLVIVAITLIHLKRAYIIPSAETSKIDTVFDNIIASMISLIGFILASLTIIVTVKSNIKIRKLEEAINGLELLLSSKNYKSIISIFRDAIIELSFSLSIIYIWWSPLFTLSRIKYLMLITFGILIIILTVSRTLILLFRIIFLEFKVKPNQPEELPN